MGRAYSNDLRERISAHVAAGHSRRAAALHFGVSPSCAVKLLQRVERTGSATPSRMGRPRGAGKLAPYLARLTGWVDKKPDIGMSELSKKLAAETGVVAHPASLSRVLILAGYRFKKNSDGERVRTR